MPLNSLYTLAALAVWVSMAHGPTSLVMAQNVIMTFPNNVHYDVTVRVLKAIPHHDVTSPARVLEGVPRQGRVRRVEAVVPARGCPGAAGD